MESLSMPKKKKTAPKKKVGKKKKGSRAKEEFRAALYSLREDLTKVAAILGITMGRLDTANGLSLNVEHQTTLTEIAERFQA